jgi:hypothetical protein
MSSLAPVFWLSGTMLEYILCIIMYLVWKEVLDTTNKWGKSKKSKAIPVTGHEGP